MDIRKIQEDNKPKKYKIANSEAKLLIVEPKPKELTELRKKCSRRTRGSRALGEILDEKKFNKALMEKFIVGWEGIVLDGKPAPCDLANKILCDDNWKDFSECWNNVVGGFEDEAEDEAEEEVKN